MVLLWRKKKKVVKDDSDRAHAALKETRATAPEVYELARELREVTRANHFAPRIKAALQLHESELRKR